jgi:CRP-like cAMP-binding protein
MQSLLRKLLNLQPGEGRKLGLLYVLGFVVATSLVWGGAIGRALFLKRIGVEWLPLMFIFDAVLTFVVTLVYTAFVDRISNARLLATIFGGVGAILLAAWGLLFLDRQGVAVPYVILVYALFYLAERVLRALFAIHVWTFFNDYLDIRAAKRAFPILGSTSRTAGIVSGALLSLTSTFLPAENLILVWIGVLALGAWISLRIPHWLTGERPEQPVKRAAGGRSSARAYWQNLAGGFQFVSASTFLKLLAAGAFAMTALLALIDYQASRVFVQVVPSAEQLAAFYGALESLTNLIALPVQMFLMSRLVSWLGVAQTNLLYPFGTLFVYAALSAWPSLGTAIAGQVSKDAFRSAVQVPVDNMLYNAVPAQLKGRARAFVKGLLLPLANISIGLLLLPIRQSGSLPYWLLGIGGAVALVQLVVALLVRRRYTQALIAMLEAEDFGAYRVAALGPPDPATFRRLLQRLRASQDDDSILFLSQIVAEAGGRGAGPLLIEVAETASPQVQAGILEMLLEADIVDEAAQDISRRSLEAQEPRLRRAALGIQERLLGSDNPALWALAAPLLADPDPETRLPAILLLVRSGDFFYLADAVRALSELLDDDTRPECRIAGLRALQAMGDARLVRSLTRYGDDPDDGVRLQAAEVMETLADPEALEWAVSLARGVVARQLADPVEGVRLSALRTLGKLGGADALEQLMAALADPSDLVREQAEQGLLHLGSAAAPLLEGVVADGLAPERVHVSAAAVLAHMARNGIVDRGDAQHYIQWTQDHVESTLRRIYADARLVAALDDLPAVSAAGSRPVPKPGLPDLDALAAIGQRSRAARQGPSRSASSRGNSRGDPANGNRARTLLHSGLNQRNERRLKGAFRLLGATLPEPRASVEVIARNLWDPSVRGEARANALEALESLTTPRLARLVGQVTPIGAVPAADLVATARLEWDLPALDRTKALETMVADPDRWLAAIAIVLVAHAGQELFGTEALQDTWLPLWLADPDPAVREAAHYAARRQEVEIEMVETTHTAGTGAPGFDDGQALSAVERALFLKQVPFFGGMTVEQLRTLAGIAEEQYYDAEETIYAEGASSEALYVVIDGRVGIEREPKQGRVQRLESLATRQFFGERTIFDGAVHESRAVALDRVHLLTIRRDHLLGLIRRSPDLSLSLVTVLSQRLREADDKLAARTRTKPDQVMRLYDKLTGDMENEP